MAPDHFPTHCWPIERSVEAHALPCTQFQHPPPAPQQPLIYPAVTRNEWSRLRNVDTKGGMSFLLSATTPLPPSAHMQLIDICAHRYTQIHTDTHTDTPTHTEAPYTIDAIKCHSLLGN